MIRHWPAICRSIDGLYYFLSPWLFPTDEAAIAELGQSFVRLATEYPAIELKVLERKTDGYVPRIARTAVTVKVGGISREKRNKT